MTGMLERLLAQFAARNLTPRVGAGGAVELDGPADQKTADVLGAVAAFGGPLAEWLRSRPAAAWPRPAGRSFAIFTAHDLTFVRAGVCRSRADGWLCWAGYAAGRPYWFEEYLAPWQRQPVASFHVFAGGSVGLAGLTKFEALFEECP